MNKVKKNALSLVILIFCSCNHYLKDLNNIVDKELYSGGGDLCPPDKLCLHKDSTFIYTKCEGPSVNFSKGYWEFDSNQTGILLKTASGSFHNQVTGGIKMLDTIFLNLNGVFVKIRDKRSVEINGQVFYVSHKGAR